MCGNFSNRPPNSNFLRYKLGIIFNTIDFSEALVCPKYSNRNIFVTLHFINFKMKALKTLALLFFIFLGTQQTFAQKYRFKTSSYSVMEKDAKGKWGKWSDFKDTNLIITLDGDKNRIVVNSQQTQLYNIEVYGTTIENDTDKTMTFNCIDNGGDRCIIEIITRKKQDNRIQFYINYPDLKIVYNIYP